MEIKRSQENSNSRYGYIIISILTFFAWVILLSILIDNNGTPYNPYQAIAMVVAIFNLLIIAIRLIFIIQHVIFKWEERYTFEFEAVRPELTLLVFVSITFVSSYILPGSDNSGGKTIFECAAESSEFICTQKNSEDKDAESVYNWFASLLYILPLYEATIGSPDKLFKYFRGNPNASNKITKNNSTSDELASTRTRKLHQKSSKCMKNILNYKKKNQELRKSNIDLSNKLKNELSKNKKLHDANIAMKNDLIKKYSEEWEEAEYSPKKHKNPRAQAGNGYFESYI